MEEMNTVYVEEAQEAETAMVPANYEEPAVEKSNWAAMAAGVAGAVAAIVGGVYVVKKRVWPWAVDKYEECQAVKQFKKEYRQGKKCDAAKAEAAPEATETPVPETNEEAAE